MIKYHKLVRDKIPEIIARSGKHCDFSILNDSDYLAMLDEKLNEDVNEEKLEELSKEMNEKINALAKDSATYSIDVANIKKEYEAKKGIVTEEAPEKVTMSGIADRPYCKGRNYDPNRYSNPTEE